MRLSFQGTFAEVMAEIGDYLLAANGRPTVGGEVASPTEPAPALKRTRRSSKATETATDTSGETTEKPKRTRRSKASPSPQTEDGGASTAETPKPRARRRKKAEEQAPEGVSDADLMKAAAMIAENYGADEVTAVLGEFKVDDVQDLAGDDRQEFIDMAMAPVGDG